MGDAARAAIDAGQPPPRILIVSMLTGLAGMSDAEANAEYDRQHAEWERMKRAGKL